MQERTLHNLILNGEDIFFNGNIIIHNYVQLKNANLIVSGNLTIYDKVNIENGNIIVSGILKIALNHDISITCGDISCGELECYGVNITDGDIWTNGDLTASDDIVSDGNIEVGGDAFVKDITCTNYLISGNNDSCDTTTTQDIYILGNNDSCSLTAREILVGGNCDTNRSRITAHHLVCDGELFCEGLFIE